MLRRKPDLIVPIRDRRQHKRYLTLRNVFFTSVALMVVFAGITIRSEMEPKSRDTLGDLVRRQMPEVDAKPVEVVREAAPAVVDQTAADPMLVAPAAREQWLRDGSTTTITPEPGITPVVTANVRPGTESRIAIVGGPEGVSVVQQRKRRPTLAGGFGR
jgi:hypothetical protein